MLVHLKLDTHSVDLTGYDLAARAILQGKDYRATPAEGWLPLNEDSHHRDGVLAFPGGSNEAWAAGGGAVELTLRGIAQVTERTLRWQF